MTFGILVTIAVAVFLLSCGASVLALYWSIKAGSHRGLGAVISSSIALVIAYVGLSCIQLHASRTVNGQLVWSLNSRWFFVAALVLGAIALALAVWKWRKVSRGRAATPPASQAGDTSGEPSGSACDAPPQH